MEKTPCGGCGSVKYYTWAKSGDVESCNDCAVVTDTTPRDAWGTKIKLAPENMGKYSHCAGEVIHSARHLSDLCRKNNWILAKQ